MSKDFVIEAYHIRKSSFYYDEFEGRYHQATPLIFEGKFICPTRFPETEVSKIVRDNVNKFLWEEATCYDTLEGGLVVETSVEIQSIVNISYMYEDLSQIYRRVEAPLPVRAPIILRGEISAYLRQSRISLNPLTV